MITCPCRFCDGGGGGGGGGGVVVVAVGRGMAALVLTIASIFEN